MLLTVQQIDHILADAHRIPLAQRGEAWHAQVDALLDQRARAGQGWAGSGDKDTRLLTPEETR